MIFLIQAVSLVKTLSRIKLLQISLLDIKLILLFTQSKAPTVPLALRIINRIFLEQDDKGISWQTRLNNDLNEQEVIETFNGWLEEFGAEAETIQKINELVYSKAVETELDKNRSVVDHKIRAKTIPTLIYDQKKHSGAFKK